MIRRQFPMDVQFNPGQWYRVPRYRVQLGYLAVTVEAADEQEALERARRKMCEEWPRLWDKIDQAEKEKFQVERI